MAVTGLLAGTLIAVQQQMGSAISVGLATLLVLDTWLDRRYGALSGATLMARLAALIGGALAVVAPILCVHAAMASVTLLLHQLIVHPLTGYRSINYSPWAGFAFLSATRLPYTSLVLLRYLPVAMLVGCARAVHLWITRHQRERLETLVVLLSFSAFSILSISYFPDFIHITFIAPVFFVFLAEIFEWLLATLRSITGMRASTVLARALAAILFVALSVQLYQNMVRAHGTYPFPRNTEFGRLDFANQKEITLVERVAAVARRAPTRELFCYPVYASMYLMTDTVNPTPHEIIAPDYQTPEALREVVETLERRQVPQVLLVQVLIRPNDPIVQYVREHYDCAADGLCVRRTGAKAG